MDFGIVHYFACRKTSSPGLQDTTWDYKYWDIQFLWAGISGMRWDELVPMVHSITNCFGIPKMVLMHCGGNDIGIDLCGKLLFHLKFAVYVISKNVTRINDCLFKYFV